MYEAGQMKPASKENSMTETKHIARVVGRILLSALESATTAANGNPEAQRWIEQLRDDLKPDLDWMMRYNRFFDIPEEGENEDIDPTYEW